MTHDQDRLTRPDVRAARRLRHERPRWDVHRLPRASGASRGFVLELELHAYRAIQPYNQGGVAR
jgi:hypothetical protein